MKIAFPGERGAYPEAAAAALFANEDIHTVPVPTHSAAIHAVEAGEVEYAVTRLEISYAGLNTRLVDLISSRNLHFTRETRLVEHFHVAGQPGALLADVRRIYAHPAILSRCQESLEQLDNVEFIARYDSANSDVELIERMDVSEATICGDFAASIYGLSIIKRNVESERDGFSRFVAVARKPETPSEEAREVRTSLIFGLSDKPGALMTCLSHFQRHGLNLENVAIRPGGLVAEGYSVYLEVCRNAAEPEFQAAIADLKTDATFVHPLGSYGIHGA